ncbi:MAG: molybdate ABC transporter substrate-binding protein, partial [Caulobacteraceae bacterium]
MRQTALLLGVCLAALTASQASAAEVSVAVAANFTRPVEEIGAAFTARTGDTVRFSFGASGALYTQITQAAPFEVFLSADDQRPAQAVTDGFGVEGTVFTYAVGKVVLYSPTIDLTDGVAVLQAGAFRHVAIADPNTAPYGKAGLEVVAKLGLTDTITPKLVTGQTITQTLQFVESGNAELGFVALSQVIGKPPTQVWMAPAEDYSPILQDAVLLKTGEANPVAKAFIAFLKGPEAADIIKTYGYD